MRRPIQLAIVALLVIAFLLPATAFAAPPVQDDAATPVTVTSARELTEIVADDDAWFASLSNSGDQIAYYSESGRGRNRVSNICIYTYENAEKACYALPEQFEPYPYDLAWSHDDVYLAFTENPIELSNESDIWVLDVASGEFMNLTDDGLTGAWRYVDGEPLLDYLPFWGPDDGSIYFWRAIPLGDLKFELGIYSIARDSVEAVLVRDLTDEIPSSLPSFKQEQFYLDGPAALSPDGATVAALMSTLDPMGMAMSSLWLIPLDGESPAVEAVANDGWSTAVPEWQTWPAAPISLSWTGDGAGVVVLESSPDPHTPFMVFDYIDAETLELAPVVDFSGLEDPESYFDIPAGGSLPWRAYSPWTATLSPAGDKLLMVNDLGGYIGLFQAQLPPDGSLPIVAKSTESTLMSTASRSSRAADGKVLVYGIVATIEE